MHLVGGGSYRSRRLRDGKLGVVGSMIVKGGKVRLGELVGVVEI